MLRDSLLLALDVGLSNFGAAVLDPSTRELWDFGAVLTSSTARSHRRKKKPRKRAPKKPPPDRMIVSHYKRSEVIISFLDSWFDVYDISQVVAETPGGCGRSAAAIRDMGFASGLFVAYAHIRNFPVVFLDGNWCGRVFNGGPGKGKEGTQKKVLSLYPEVAAAGLNKKRLEAVCDAIQCGCVHLDKENMHHGREKGTT